MRVCAVLIVLRIESRLIVCAKNEGSGLWYSARETDVTCQSEVAILEPGR